MWAPCSALPKPFFLSLFFYGCLLRLDIRDEKIQDNNRRSLFSGDSRPYFTKALRLWASALGEVYWIALILTKCYF